MNEQSESHNDAQDNIDQSYEAGEKQHARNSHKE